MVVACVTKENRGEVSLYIGSDRAHQLIWKTMANISFELSICLIRKVFQKNFLNTENAKLKSYSQPRFPSLEDLAANVVSPHYAKKLPPLLCCLSQSLHFLASQDQSTHRVFTTMNLGQHIDCSQWKLELQCFGKSEHLFCHHNGGRHLTPVFKFLLSVLLKQLQPFPNLASQWDEKICSEVKDTFSPPHTWICIFLFSGFSSFVFSP